jgi:uncharacterized protein (TIGR00369 family)
MPNHAMQLTAEELQNRLARNHLANWMGLKVVHAAAGQIRLSSPWRDEFISNPDHRFAHGGILATLLDTAGSYAVATLLGRPAQTIDMRVDFLRPGFESELTVDANVLHFGHTVASVDASIFNRNNHLLATGRMVFLTSSHKPAAGISRPSSGVRS